MWVLSSYELINVLLAFPSRGSWKLALYFFFGVIAVFGWMPCHNSRQKNVTYIHILLSCFLVSWLPLSRFIMSISIKLDPRKKTKGFALYPNLQTSAAVLHQSFCIHHRAEHALCSEECKMTLSDVGVDILTLLMSETLKMHSINLLQERTVVSVLKAFRCLEKWIKCILIRLNISCTLMPLLPDVYIVSFGNTTRVPVTIHCYTFIACFTSFSHDPTVLTETMTWHIIFNMFFYCCCCGFPCNWSVFALLQCSVFFIVELNLCNGATC